METNLIDFLTKQRVGSFATILKDGSPHSAALHFSHQNEPFELYFSTDNTSLKVQDLLDGKTSKASFVVGFSEEEWITVQMDGEVSVVADEEELKKIHKIHYAKITQAEKYKDDPSTLFLKFNPKWWRYSDYNTDPPIILQSK
jgi:general stress protein 26